MAEESSAKDNWFIWTSQMHAKLVLQNLYEQCQSRQFCDLNLTVGRDVFQAHKAVLCAASPYFHAMFSIDMVEAEKTNVTIHEVTTDVFKHLLDFIYTGDLAVCEENCQDLLVAANMFQLQGAVKICCAFLKKQLHPSNCIGIYQFCETQGCVELSNASLSYIYSHFMDVLKEDEFSEISKDVLVQLLKSENLQIESEFQVFSAAMSWILCNLTGRRKYIFDVLGPVRFPIISRKQLNKYIEECPDLSLQIALRKIVQDYKKHPIYGGYDTTWRQVKPYLFIPRKCAIKNIYVVGGYRRDEGGRWSDSQSLSTVECFNTFHEYWRSLPPLHHTRSGHGVCVVNEHIYAIGGESDSLIYDNAECFDPATNTWSMIAGMTVPRCGLAVVAVEGLIYAIGGWVGSDIGNTVEKYDPTSNIWSEVDTVPTVRFAMGITANNGEIYLVGGMSDLGTEMKLVESFCPIYREWQTLPPMNVPRAYVGVAVLDGYMYAVGGWNEENGALNTVERFSFKLKEWNTIASMKYERAGASVAAVNGLLYAIGGRASPDTQFSAPPTLKTVECYDPQTETWFTIGPMPTGRCEAGVAVV